MDERKQESSEHTVKFEQIIGDAAQSFREGMSVLSDWGAQLRGTLDRRPGVVLTGVALLGFLAGMVIRRGRDES